MGYINLTGDSNGDLHDAEMHNAKFGAIASVLNGNVDRDNLSAPLSYLTWSINNGASEDEFALTAGATVVTGDVFSNVGAVPQSATDSTAGVMDVASFVAVETADRYYLVMDSVRRAPTDMTLSNATGVVFQQNGTTGNDFNILIQKASTSSGTYTTIGTGTFDAFTSNTNVTPTSFSTTITSPSISQGEFIRVLFQAPNVGGSYPSGYSVAYPVFNLLMTFKVYHTA